MSFGSGFIIVQVLGNSHSSHEKHALEQENYELKRKNDELVHKMHILEKKLEIATKALKKLTRHCDKWEIAREALREMGGAK